MGLKDVLGKVLLGFSLVLPPTTTIMANDMRKQYTVMDEVSIDQIKNDLIKYFESKGKNDIVEKLKSGYAVQEVEAYLFSEEGFHDLKRNEGLMREVLLYIGYSHGIYPGNAITILEPEGVKEALEDLNKEDRDVIKYAVGLYDDIVNRALERKGKEYNKKESKKFTSYLIEVYMKYGLRAIPQGVREYLLHPEWRNEDILSLLEEEILNQILSNDKFPVITLRNRARAYSTPIYRPSLYLPWFNPEVVDWRVGMPSIYRSSLIIFTPGIGMYSYFPPQLFSHLATEFKGAPWLGFNLGGYISSHEVLDSDYFFRTLSAFTNLYYVTNMSLTDLTLNYSETFHSNGYTNYASGHLLRRASGIFPYAYGNLQTNYNGNMFGNLFATPEGLRSIYLEGKKDENERLIEAFLNPRTMVPNIPLALGILEIISIGGYTGDLGKGWYSWIGSGPFSTFYANYHKKDNFYNALSAGFGSLALFYDKGKGPVEGPSTFINPFREGREVELERLGGLWSWSEGFIGGSYITNGWEFTGAINKHEFSSAIYISKTKLWNHGEGGFKIGRTQAFWLGGLHHSGFNGEYENLNIGYANPNMSLGLSHRRENDLSIETGMFSLKNDELRLLLSPELITKTGATAITLGSVIDGFFTNLELTSSNHPRKRIAANFGKANTFLIQAESKHNIDSTRALGIVQIPLNEEREKKLAIMGVYGYDWMGAKTEISLGKTVYRLGYAHAPKYKDIYSGGALSIITFPSKDWKLILFGGATHKIYLNEIRKELDIEGGVELRLKPASIHGRLKYKKTTTKNEKTDSFTLSAGMAVRLK